MSFCCPIRLGLENRGEVTDLSYRHPPLPQLLHRAQRSRQEQRNEIPISKLVHWWAHPSSGNAPRPFCGCSGSSSLQSHAHPFDGHGLGHELAVPGSLPPAAFGIQHALGCSRRCHTWSPSCAPACRQLCSTCRAQVAGKFKQQVRVQQRWGQGADLA